MAEPILKWPGGKGWSKPYLSAYLSPEILDGHTYIEPFIGGGSIAFNLEYQNTIINDINPELINLYKIVADYPEELIAELTKFAQFHSDEFYYTVRAWDRDPNFNSYPPVKRAARTVYLNKTGFNGLYRVNKKGYFNVPIGRTTSGKMPDIVQADKIRRLSTYLKQGVKILNLDYKEVIEMAQPGSILFLDPPYSSFPGKNGFVSYAKDGWTDDDLEELRNLCNFKIQQGCHIILTNNATPRVVELFSTPDYHIDLVDVKRSINSKGDGRGAVKEVIIVDNELFSKVNTKIC